MDVGRLDLVGGWPGGGLDGPHLPVYYAHRQGNGASHRSGVERGTGGKARLYRVERREDYLFQLAEALGEVGKDVRL
jgi:hypothetical protein